MRQILRKRQPSKTADKTANQAWSIDITYIRIKHGFLYLTAVIDWYSRCIVGWEVDGAETEIKGCFGSKKIPDRKERNNGTI